MFLLRSLSYLTVNAKFFAVPPCRLLQNIHDNPAFYLLAVTSFHSKNCDKLLTLFKKYFLRF